MTAGINNSSHLKARGLAISSLGSATFSLASSARTAVATLP